MAALHLRQLGLDVLRLCLWLGLLMAIFVPLERRWALHQKRVFRRAFVTDLAYYFLNGLLPGLVLVLSMTTVAWCVHYVVPSTLYSAVAAVPPLARFPAAMIVGEFGFYWGHRWMHEVPLLWRFHAVHHSAEEIDWLVNTRAHPVDMVVTRLCGFVPMYVLGLAQPMGNSVDVVPLLVTFVGVLWGFFIHANLRWRLGWFEWVVSSPAFHHWHHTLDGPSRSNVNYASMLPWVDRCFGTLYLPKKRWPRRYGSDAPMPAGFAAQLLQPLARIVRGCET
jgi:sterol desaturase/sphingolipid hydroxylase (fatty acid hydroxylase superfamily)